MIDTLLVTVTGDDVDGDNVAGGPLVDDSNDNSIDDHDNDYDDKKVYIHDAAIIIMMHRKTTKGNSNFVSSRERPH